MTYAEIADQYIVDVLSGEIPACKWVKLACERQQKDLARQGSDGFKYIWNPELVDLEGKSYRPAERVCNFIEHLPHVKGKWARDGLTISLEPWQVFALTTVFGWVDPEGLRRFRTSYEEVPRKNAKTTKASGVGLYMLARDDEAGAEVYSAATTADQARISWSIAKDMARKSQGLQRRFGIAALAHSITREAVGSFFQYLSSDSKSLDGKNTHCSIVDELHAHKTREVFDVVETSTGSREQPLIYIITTAGSNRAGICYEQRTYVTKILQGVVEDDTYFGIIYTIDDGDDWTDSAVWAKANPNFGVSVFPDDIARLCNKAQQMPSAQNNFLTKRLNVWVNADTSWMDMRSWDKCADESLAPEDFDGQPCLVALDLASKIDIAAMIQLFEKDGHYYCFGRYYLPEDTVMESGNSQYQGWMNSGRLTTTPGNVIDFEYIEDDLNQIAEACEVSEVPFDPFQATQFSTRMMAEGFNMVEMRPTVLNFSEPMKQLEALVLSGKFHHNGDPVLTWMISNVVCHLDVKDNIYPRKERPENKIDGVVALIMALGRSMAGDVITESVYADRGIRVL